MSSPSKPAPRNRQLGSNARGLPIPSFASDPDRALGPNDHDESDNGQAPLPLDTNETSRKSVSPSAAVSPRPWDLRDTKRIEQLVAGLIQFSRRGNSKPQTAKIPLHELEDIVRKLWPLPVIPLRANRQNRLTDEVRQIVFYLLCCSSAGTHEDNQAPLFRLVRNNTAVFVEVNSLMFHDPNPMSHFMRVWNTKQNVPQNITQNILTDLEQCTVPKVDPAVISVSAMRPLNTSADVLVGKAIVTVGKTVEERVKARAKARQQQNQEEEQVAMVTAATKNNLLDSDLWSYANILWSHARSVQQRQKNASITKQTRFQNFHVEQQKKPGGVVILTLKDAVLVLQSSTAIQNRPNRRQAVTALHKLCEMAPDWLLLSPRANSFDPNSTLWIFYNEKLKLDHAWLESKFGLERGASSSDKKQPLITLEPSARSVAAVMENDAASSPLAAAPPTRSVGVETEAFSVQAAVVTATGNERFPQAVPNRDEPISTRDDGISGPRTRRSLFAEPQSSPAPTDHKRKSSSGEKDKPEAEDTSKEHKRRRKTASALRVNHNFILSDADYQGGEQLVPGLHDSPRGLKRLFRQMKQGQRI